MTTIEIPAGVTTEIKGGDIIVKGPLGSVAKKLNTKLIKAEMKDGKLTLTANKNQKLNRKAELAVTALDHEVTETIKTVQKAIEQKMKVVFAHFPMSIEIKGNVIFLKNVFGEKVPRQAVIVGSTKVEVKGQDFTIKGIDNYEIGQTIANIRQACKARGYDTRVFQDGVYLVTEE